MFISPALIVFSLIGGKQAHYLLPLLPGVALLLATALDDSALSVRTGLAAAALLVLGVAFAWLPQIAAARPELAFVADTLPWWGAGIGVIGLVLLLAARRIREPFWPAIATFESGDSSPNTGAPNEVPHVPRMVTSLIGAQLNATFGLEVPRTSLY